MLIHHERKLIYLSHAKTGSHAIVKSLEQVGFIQHGWHHARLNTFNREDPDEWISITTVRNHWDIVVSWMFARFNGPPPKWNKSAVYDALGDYHQPGRIPHQNRHILNREPPGKWSFFRFHEDANAILRYESLQEDLHHYVPDAPLLRVVNPTPNKPNIPYERHYTNETHDLVLFLFQEEIAKYGYL